MCVDGRGTATRPQIAKLQGGRPDRTSGHQRACDDTAMMKLDDVFLCHLPLLAAALSPARSRGQRRPWKVAVGSAPTAFPGLTPLIIFMNIPHISRNDHSLQHDPLCPNKFRNIRKCTPFPLLKIEPIPSHCSSIKIYTPGPG